MKQQFRKSVLAVSMLGLMAGMSGSVMAATAEGRTNAVVERSIGPLPIQDLSFGRFAGTDTGGTVAVDPASCDVTTALPHFGNQTCGTFLVTGAPGESYVINYPSTAVITNTDSGATMEYSLLLDGSSTKTLDTNGRSDVQFGGSLAVTPSQDLGVYTGTYEISVDYINAS